MIDECAVSEKAIAFFDLFLISLMRKLGHLEKFLALKNFKISSNQRDLPVSNFGTYAKKMRLIPLRLI